MFGNALLALIVTMFVLMIIFLVAEFTGIAGMIRKKNQLKQAEIELKRAQIQKELEELKK